MPPTTKNLGFVQPVFVGPSPPSNTKQIWFDTTINRHKIFDFDSSTFILLVTGSGTEDFAPKWSAGGIDIEDSTWKHSGKDYLPTIVDSQLGGIATANRIDKINIGGTNSEINYKTSLSFVEDTNERVKFGIGGGIGIGTPASIDGTALLNITSTTKGVLFPRMTTSQRDAISSPTTSLLVYNSDVNDFEFFNGISFIPLSTQGYLIQRVEIPTGDTLTVRNGERAIVFGNFTINGTLDVQGTGEFININGANRTIAVFDPAGTILTDTLIKVETDGRINLPIFSPGGPGTKNIGDMWLEESSPGVIRLHVVNTLNIERSVELSV